MACAGLLTIIYGAYLLATSSPKQRWELLKINCFAIGGALGGFLERRGHSSFLGLPIIRGASFWTPMGPEWTASLVMKSSIKSEEGDFTDLDFVVLDSSDIEKCSTE